MKEYEEFYNQQLKHLAGYNKDHCFSYEQLIGFASQCVNEALEEVADKAKLRIHRTTGKPYSGVETFETSQGTSISIDKESIRSLKIKATIKNHKL